MNQPGGRAFAARKAGGTVPAREFGGWHPPWLPPEIGGGTEAGPSLGLGPHLLGQDDGLRHLPKRLAETKALRLHPPVGFVL